MSGYRYIPGCSHWAVRHSWSLHAKCLPSLLVNISQWSFTFLIWVSPVRPATHRRAAKPPLYWTELNRCGGKSDKCVFRYLEFIKTKAVRIIITRRKTRVPLDVWVGYSCYRAAAARPSLLSTDKLVLILLIAAVPPNPAMPAATAGLSGFSGDPVRLHQQIVSSEIFYRTALPCFCSAETWYRQLVAVWRHGWMRPSDITSSQMEDWNTLKLHPYQQRLGEW